MLDDGRANHLRIEILAGYTPVITATAVKRLEDAGMVLLGKTNMDELRDGALDRELGLWRSHATCGSRTRARGSSGGTQQRSRRAWRRAHSARIRAAASPLR
ncbi:MAG: hypothetical protein IPK17_21960 [Chloroflexi bacterium]|uniref:amidase family protein n=1 Tax=Candidatus Flexifilum breve TaxID=3140694 RepID=UPI003135EC6C|nr:hypothetical protein [Chloroflexota bacterium]